jgi:hypothetical protein
MNTGCLWDSGRIVRLQVNSEPPNSSNHITAKKKIWEGAGVFCDEQAYL